MTGKYGYPILAAALVLGTILFAGGAHAQTSLFPLGKDGLSSRGLDWESAGPSAISVSDIVYHPSVSGLVFMAAYEGLYVSGDGGMSWHLVIPAVASKVRLDPFDPAAILVNRGSEIYRSTDWGRSWQLVFSISSGADSKSVTCLEFDPGRQGVVYATTRLGNEWWDGAGVYRSADGGLTWTEMEWCEYPDTMWAKDILIHPAAGTVLAARTNHYRWELVKSTDGGATWNDVGDGLDTKLDLFDLDWLCPGVAGLATEDGLYYRKQGTARWQKVLNELAGKYCRILRPGPSRNIWYASVGYGFPASLYRSDDYGRTWTPRSDGYEHRSITDIAVNPHDPPGAETVLIGYMGLFASKDQGLSWKLICDGLPSMGCGSLEFGPAGSGLIYTMSDYYASTLYRSSNLGQTWSIANPGVGSRELISIAAHTSDDQVVFGATEREGLFRSTDRGDTWSLLYNGIPVGGAQYVTTTPDGTVWAYFDLGLYRSTDIGDSWSRCDSGLGDGDVVDLACDPLNPLHLFVALTETGIYESEDGGASWNLVLGDWGFDSVAVAPGGQRVYAGKEPYHPYNGKFYRSTDGGDNWTLVIDLPAGSIVVPEDHPMVVICGGGRKGKVFISLDGGDNWTPKPIGGPSSEATVHQLVIPPPGSQGFLYAATSEGIQRLTWK